MSCKIVTCSKATTPQPSISPTNLYEGVASRLQSINQTQYSIINLFYFSMCYLQAIKFFIYLMRKYKTS